MHLIILQLLSILIYLLIYAFYFSRSKNYYICVKVKSAIFFKQKEQYLEQARVFLETIKLY